MCVSDFGYVSRTIKPLLWWTLVAMVIAMVVEVHSLNGENVCIVKQKYNITKRVKYRAPMSVRTYEWCFSMPPRCSKWSTEMRDLTRLETEQRVAEMAVCCPGYKMKDVSCVPICPFGKTGHLCTEECPPKKWGPNCVHDCKRCNRGTCSPFSGECQCQQGWQGESCESIITTTPAPMMEQILTNATKPSASTLEPSRTTETLTAKPTTIVETKSTEATSSPTSTETRTSLITTISFVYNNVTQTSPNVTFKNLTETTKIDANTFITSQSIQNNTDLITTTDPPIANVTEKPTFVTTMMYFTTSKTTPVESFTTVTEPPIVTTKNTVPTVITTTDSTTTKPETTRKTEATVKQTTIKVKPKEIWIRPAQKGDQTFIDKHKLNLEKHKHSTKKDSTPETTTPKTIIVSIIPTSVSYTSFKKMALSTTTGLQKNVAAKINKSTEGFTRPIFHTTSVPFTVKLLNVEKKIVSTLHPIQNVTKTSSTTESVKSTVALNRHTNSMSTNEVKHLSSNSLTTPSISTNFARTVMVSSSVTPIGTVSFAQSTIKTVKPSHTNPIFTTKQPITARSVIFTKTPMINVKISKEDIYKENLTKTNIETNIVTDAPTKDEETFHILTEPEHITAVMGDKTSEKSSVDLISVISIAGGVMMSIITVAIVIVMLERCKRPNYEGSRKYNDIRMQVMIDKNDVPPPYVRSIFHTPLPDPPTSEKCHYQPISTLDRNLKQFMRPVVVQTISPLMLENFRGILECHYDHLPRRSQDYDPMPTRHSLTPSMEESVKLLQSRCHSITDSTIESLKCEAKLDIIDSTTSEPLYAEIPCWRPPSEQHAVEVLNTSGEAVTEL